ncbi:hypothetical protein Q766_17175 [Flavobacterium subsaxonicum WB 4.1-42 = DSM 21790]|uniref:Uncharacterized protein n=2 Tax=Flavobacterium TaxID=237 RepID=A0A0A2MH48_9FLAO|nr:hypothetical protein Q766_17175 [Flavobacterium subsaxonicum WB 4.1-42 = DSM 21790]
MYLFVETKRGMKKILQFIVLLTILTVKGQDRHPMYFLEFKLMEANKQALFDIGPYFDDKSIIVENLGYHRLQPSVAQVSKRIVDENTLFTKTEILVDTATTAQFLGFLNKNNDKIVFSDLANAFLITPLEKREIRYQVRQVPTVRMAELKAKSAQLFTPQWVVFNQIDSLIKKKNPKALLLIASELFKKRYRYDRHYFNYEEFTSLLEHLTGTVIGVEDERKEISWHIDEDFEPNSKLNLLIYFSKYYKQYKWDDKKGIFNNAGQTLLPFSKEAALFSQLSSNDSTIAINAFIELTNSNVNEVTKLAKEYDESSISFNYTLPGFAYRFLQQLVKLTAYCRANGIDLTYTPTLRADIELLKTDLSFKERRAIENRLINGLTLDTVTAFEYWSLIYEKNGSLSYSAGRIVDVFYSGQWDKMLADKKQTNLFLKKAILFKRLYINGVCYNYRAKFAGASAQILSLFDDYNTTDDDIKYMASLIRPLQTQEYKVYPVHPLDTTQYYVRGLELKLKDALKGWADTEEQMDTLEGLVSQISYSQIGTVLKLMDKVTFTKPYDAYSFLDRDFGFFWINEPQDPAVRRQFMDNYNQYSEFELYSYYLCEAGIDYKNSNGSLNYDKIYDLIKYGETEMLAGGGPALVNETYALIKLLEITFKTTLDLSSKYCSSQNMYNCHVVKKVKAWSHYLTNNNLLQLPHNEPVSFNAFNH